MTAKSAYSHSMRVEDAIATRSWGLIPSASNPAATVLTVSAACAHVTDSQPPGTGER